MTLSNVIQPKSAQLIFDSFQLILKHGGNKNVKKEIYRGFFFLMFSTNKKFNSEYSSVIQYLEIHY